MDRVLQQRVSHLRGVCKRAMFSEEHLTLSADEQLGNPVVFAGGP